MVNFVRASHQCLSMLKKTAAQILTHKRGLQSSNKTRLTSVHACLASFAPMEMVFKVILNQHADFLDGATQKKDNDGMELLSRLEGHMEAVCACPCCGGLRTWTRMLDLLLPCVQWQHPQWWWVRQGRRHRPLARYQASWRIQRRQPFRQF